MNREMNRKIKKSYAGGNRTIGLRIRLFPVWYFGCS